MTRAELEEMIRNGEGSGVEFKLDDVENHDLAKEIVAFANLAGGVILLGVADDGTVQGTKRDDLEEWVMETYRVKMDPPIIPYFQWYRGVLPGKDVTVARVSAGPDKPYARVHNNRRNYFIRVGSASREASREELVRMFQASGHLRYGVRPVPGALFGDLDLRRLKDYFDRILSQTHPEDSNVGPSARKRSSTWLRYRKPYVRRITFRYCPTGRYRPGLRVDSRSSLLAGERMGGPQECTST